MRLSRRASLRDTEMQKKVQAAGKKAKKHGSEDSKVDKAQEAKQEVDSAIGEGYKPLPKERMARQITKTRGAEERAARAGDQAGTNKLMKRRIAQVPYSMSMEVPLRAHRGCVPHQEDQRCDG